MGSKASGRYSEQEHHQRILAHLGLEITVDIAKLVQLVDSNEHLRRVKSRKVFEQYAGLVQERTEVTAGDVFLGSGMYKSWVRDV